MTGTRAFATQEAAQENTLNVLASIYRRAIERYEESKQGGPAQSRPDDAKKGSQHDRAELSIPETD